MKQNYIIIKNKNLINNIKKIKNTTNFQYYILDVSNNAFNHGIKIITYLNDLIDYYYINQFESLLSIRKYNTECSVIYDGEINQDNIYDLIVHNAIIMIDSLQKFEYLLSFDIKDACNIILKIDLNGFLGINSQKEIKKILELLKDNKKITILGIKANINKKQNKEFNNLINNIKDTKLMILNDEENINKINNSNAVKLDYSIYGITKKKKFLKSKTNFKQAFTLQSTIINIHKKGKKIYAIIPFGYLQGLNKCFKNVYINEKKYKIKKIFANYTVIKANKSLKINDDVTISSDKLPSINNLTTLQTFYLPIFYQEKEKK